MRILKKSLSLLIALTMIVSLVTVSAVEPTESFEIIFGETKVLSSTEAQTVEIPVYIKNTESTAFWGLNGSFTADAGVTFTGFTLDKQELQGVPEQYWPLVLEGATLTPEGSTILIEGVFSGSEPVNFSVFETETKIGTATFEVAAKADDIDYAIGFTVADGGLKNAAIESVPYEVTEGKITVYEEQWIYDTEEVELSDIEYGADASEIEASMPETVKGVGVTSSGDTIDADSELTVDLDVVWEDIVTFVEPGEYAVNGEITTQENDELKFKDVDGEAIDAPGATANYTIAKSTAGVVEDVAIEVEARYGGDEAGIADIVELAEVAAVTETEIAIDGGEIEAVTLDWANAAPAGDDETLNLGTAEDSIVLSVPVTGNTTYYDLTDKTAEVTITVKPAVEMYNEIEDVVVETAVEYGAANGPVLPDTVTGSGQTVGGQTITAEYSADFQVDWDHVSTFQAPGEKTVNGTVAKPANELIQFKNAEYTADVDTLTAVATYTIAKSKAGVVAPVATIEVRQKDAGVETGIEGIRALPEVLAVTATTIAIEGGETENVTLNWAAATIADAQDTGLNLGSETDSIVLNVPIIGETTYYDLADKYIPVTIQMIKPWEYGNVNDVGGIDVADLLYLRLRLVNNAPADFVEEAANIHNPGTTGVDVGDLLIMRKKLVNQSLELPVVE